MTGGDSTTPTCPAERWPLILWTIWGAIIAGLVVWLDKNPLVAAILLAAGMAYGCVAPFLWQRFLFPVMEGYQQFWNARLYGDRSWDLLHDVLESAEFHRLFASGSSQKELESLLEMVLSRAPHSERYKRLIAEESFGALLGLPVFLALVHGSLLGGIVGALCPLDPDVHLSAWQGVALGIALGPICVSFIAAIVIAVMPMPKELSPLTLSRRALMVISPFLVIPIAWRYLTTRVLHRPTA